MLMLLFQSGSSRYAIQGDVVIEVVPSVVLISLPTAPPPVIGLLNYGGSPLPVLDFCILMEERPSRDALHTRILLLQGTNKEKNLLVGLRAEKVTEVFEAEPEDFKDKGITCSKWPFLDGVIAQDKGLIQKVDAEKLFEWYSNVIQFGLEAAMQGMEKWNS